MPVHVPTYEPEIIQAEADKLWRGDTEKVASTSIPFVEYKGVRLESRYQQADEFEIMSSGVDALPAAYLKRVVSVFCDSKATYCYTLETSFGDDWFLKQTGKFFETGLFTRAPNGHNGIYVDGVHDGQSVEICPSWDEGDA